MSLKSAICLLGQQDRVVVWEIVITFPDIAECWLRGSYREMLYKHDGFVYYASVMRDKDILAERRFATAEEAEKWLQESHPVIKE